MTNTSTDESIAAQVAEFNPGFNEQVGPVLADVFAQEQADLNAAGLPDGVVAVGDTVADASLLTPAGDGVTLASVLDGTPSVLVFYRGAWCPYCNITLRTYQQDLLPELASRGVRLVAVSPQKPDKSDESVKNGELGFDVLSDAGSQLIRSLGILTAPSDAAGGAHNQLGFDVADYNADDTRGIPYPTVLVLDADRVVRFADVHVDYTTRTEVSTILAAVDAL
jgi:peroxiredoxin